MYYFSFTFYDYVKKGLLLNISVLDSPLISGYNNQLDKYVYSVGLYEYTPGYARTSAITNSTASAGQVVVATSISLAIVSNPSAAWALLNTIQIIGYIPLNSNPLTPGLFAFITGLGQYNLIPNSFEYIFDSNTTGTPYLQASKYGFSTSVFLINLGPDITIFLFFLTL